MAKLRDVLAKMREGNNAESQELAKEAAGWSSVSIADQGSQQEKLLREYLSRQQEAFNYKPNAQDQATLDSLRAQLLNRNFSYDPEKDGAAEAIRKEYVQGGKLAARDTLGTASAMTGGLANSYARQAAQQTQGAYMSEYATKVIPTLEEMARAKHEAETQDILTKMGIIQDKMETDYSRALSEYQQRMSERDKADNYRMQLASIADSRQAAQAESSAELAQETDKKIRSSFSGIVTDKKSGDLTEEEAFESVLALQTAYGLSGEDLKTELFVLYPGLNYNNYTKWLRNKNKK